MVRAILAIVGVLLIWYGNSINEQGVVNIGSLAVAPAAITILIKIGSAFFERLERKTYWRDQERKAEEEAKALQAKRENGKKKQHQLVEKYVSGSLIPMALKVLCQGDYTRNAPEKIVVWDDRLEGTLLGRNCVFSFVEHRFYNLSYTSCWYSLSDEEEVLVSTVRPQVAMAEAINRIMRQQYEIRDRANIEPHRHDDGDVTWFYTSHCVELIRKDTLPNRRY